MNFKIIEGDYADLDNIREEFTNDYLFNQELSVVEIRKKYNLTVKEFHEFCRTVKEEHGLTRRPTSRILTGKYYYPVKNRFKIMKTIGDKLVYIGSCDSEECAIRLVELCKQYNWDIEICRKIVASYT